MTFLEKFLAGESVPASSLPAFSGNRIDGTTYIDGCEFRFEIFEKSENYFVVRYHDKDYETGEEDLPETHIRLICGTPVFEIDKTVKLMIETLLISGGFKLMDIAEKFNVSIEKVTEIARNKKEK